MNISKQTISKSTTASQKQRNYNEIVEFLDKNWSIKKDAKSLDRIKQLDNVLGSPSQKLKTLHVCGTNGKSLTVHLTSKLLKEEGLKIGIFYSPHILTYNERLVINEETISNKVFTDIANEVINAAEQLNMQPHSYEVLTMMALMYFVQNEVEVALIEVNDNSAYNPTNICNAKVVAITRITANNINTNSEELNSMIVGSMAAVKNATWVVSGDQSKAHLQLMQDLTKKNNGNWAMPIRKLANLPYPYEQLHGRCAALAERIAQLFVEKSLTRSTTLTSDSLLTKQKGTRGRPTLEVKRHMELNPRKTVEQFWKEEINELPARFQLLEKEKPSILLDIASNYDAFKNLLLGVRLLHYQRSLKGLTIIVGAAKDTLHNEEFLKLIRYFFKKTSGQLLICPIEQPLSGTNESVSWDVEQVTNDVKAMKVKARACKNFEEAFDIAKKSVDERNGLVVITGSRSIINNYWQLKGIKKF